jgi:hypothetical protein
MAAHVFLLKPAEPGVFDDMPTRPFRCTVIAHYPVTGSYAHVVVVSLSPEDEKANHESLGGRFPFTSDGALMVNGTRHTLEFLPVAEGGAQALELAVSTADIGSG